MDRNVLHRFFAGTASFEEEEAVCDWVDASNKNREELIRERKYFDVLLLHKTKNSSMVSPFQPAFCYQRIAEDRCCNFRIASVCPIHI